MYTVAAGKVSEGESELAALVNAAKGGDRAAQSALIGRFRRVALAYASARLRDPDAAEDAAQEAFVKALGNLTALRQPEKFGPWLMQLVRNQCEDAARRRKVRASVPLDASWESRQPTPETSAVEADRLHRLHLATQRLPEKLRLPLSLFYIAGLSYREVALALNLKETTVQGRLAQGLRLLRRYLNPEDFL